MLLTRTMRDDVLVAVLAVAMLPLLQAEVDDGCLSCLCQAATGCDANRDCDADTCGMLAISRRYWKDAGEPGGDFETCALDPACATQCVQAYLQRFARDCDGDGAVDCMDHARVHRLGREGCDAVLDGDFSERFAACNASIPLGDFYARAVSRPSRQGNFWNGGSSNAARQQPSGGSPSYSQQPSGGSPSYSQQPSGGSPSYSFSPSLSVSRSVTVNPTYQSGGGGGGYPTSQSQGTNGYQQGSSNFQSTSRGYQGGGYNGYNSVSGYQQGGGYGGYGGYDEAGYLSQGRRRVGGYGGYGQSLSGWTGGYQSGGGSVLWGAGEGYRPRGSSGNGAVLATRGVSANCLSCICNALTGCDPYAGCSGGGCGPFKLSLAYWQDCGSPGQSYEYCTRDYSCSSSCVQTYLSKYAQDCNGDGVIDCRDYARLHRLGGFGCRGSLDGAYRARVDTCSGY